MKIEDVKKQMKEYKDFFGGNLIDVDEIDACTNKGELRRLIDRHSEHIEMQCSDALGHLDRLTERLFIIKH